MKTSGWLRVFSVILLFHIFIIASTSLSLSTLKDNIQDEKHLLTTTNQHKPKFEDEETVGEPRWMASYYFPLLPQFYNLDYGGVWNWLKRGDTIGYFVIRDIITVSNEFKLY